MSLTTGKTQIAASGNDTFNPNGLESNLYHTITVTGSGVAQIELKHLDNDYITVATGVTAEVNTYVMYGCSAIKITETGGASAIEVSLASMDV